MSSVRISVFGLGYVGVVSASCFVHCGHKVVGVDINEDKVRSINDGRSPIVEPRVDELIAQGVASGKLLATQDARRAVAETDVSLICVGTPSRPNGKLDISAVEKVCAQIGSAIADKQKKHAVILRSTMWPGSTRDVIIPILEKSSNSRAGEIFGVAYNPEFLREGTAVNDFLNPPKTVIGTFDQETARLAASLYDGIDAPLIMTRIETSEMVKYVDNVWHAMKVCFGNEVGNMCKAEKIDSHAVMDIFFQDRKLNISPAYLKPGFAFGGSCLPKDTRAFLHRSKELDVHIPLISSITESNRHQIDRAMRLIMARGKKRIAFLGISFKAGTDDLRESPFIELIESLIGKGYDLKLYDKNVSLALLTGSNKNYIENTIPHISNLLSDNLDDVLSHGEIVVVGNNAPEFRSTPHQIQSNQHLVDLARLEDTAHLGDRYEGINWALEWEEAAEETGSPVHSRELAGPV